MGVPAPWLATLVEQCLGSYLGHTAQADIEVEDDGATLRFRKSGLTPVAAVAEWGIGPSHNSARLMDADNQILAIFPQDLSDTSMLTPNTHSKETSPRKHRIQLLDFAMVFTYATYPPDVQLNVNRFCIIWQEGIIKGLTPTKKLRRNQTVKVLLDKALQQVKDKKSKPSMSPHSPQLLDRHPAQTLSQPHHGTQLQGVFSQVSTHNDGEVCQNPFTDRRLLHGADELLQHLDPSSRSSLKTDVAPTMEGQARAVTETLKPSNGHLRAFSGDETTINGGGRRSISPQGRYGREDSISSQAQNKAFKTPSKLKKEKSPFKGASFPEINQRVTMPALLDSSEQAIAQPTSPKVSRSMSRKRHRESPGVQPVSDCGNSHPPQAAQAVTPGFISAKRQRVEKSTAPNFPAQQVTLIRRAAEPSSSPKDKEIELNSSPEIGPVPSKNPWEGFTKIRDVDITIPRDQQELLDDNTCWIPPVPGNPPPHGHVPPRLLIQWNNIARRRHQLNQEKTHNKDIERRPETSTSRQGSISSSGSGSETSEVGSIDWPDTPVKEPHILPPESSPLRRPISSRPNAAPKMNSQGETLDHSPRTRNSKEHEWPQVQITGPRPTSPIGPNESNVYGSLVSTQGEAKGLGVSGRLISEGSPAHPNPQESAQVSLHSKEVSPSNPGTPQSVADVLERETSTDEDSDEESVMENSVPFALGESLPPTQCSQLELETVGSAQPLSQAPTDHVQVAVTPLLGSNRDQRLPSDNQKNVDSPRPQFSSQSHKLSSQSRVPNTYPFTESNEKSQSSDDPTTSSLLPSHSDELRAEIAVPQTQSSRTSSAPQGTYDHSTHEFVLESSDPSQGYHVATRLNSDIPPKPSTYPFTSSANLNSSQSPDSTHEPTPQVSISEPKTVDVSVPSSGHPQSATPPEMTQEIQQVTHASPATQNAELVAQRSSFLGELGQSAEAQETYRKFCDDYPVYNGDYRHFAELCSKLQAVRSRGLLQRSNLWDDFIIMNLQRYPSYIEECESHGSTDRLGYEDWFIMNIPKSMNKKRSLSAHAIEVVASRLPRPDLTTTQAGSSLGSPLQSSPSQAPNTSLATSFVDRFSNFHAHSFEQSPRNGPLVLQSGLPALGDHATSSMETGDSPVLIKLEGSDIDSNEIMCTQIAPMSSLDDLAAICDSRQDIADSQPTSNQNSKAHGEQDDFLMAEDEAARSEELAADDTYHETASVELGDDTFISTVSQPRASEIPESQLESENELEEEEENWFVSLRKIWSRDDPVWSDHPTTPFKTWAEADQNVLSERRRRGGAKILLDEKGVIRRPVQR